mmetsp:Transcript_2913/g.7396  ORF Transcript_2913/g.7396 Transcript_2913/m.7396 type:complete len:215 (+) Transcript_2913:528-1172(+)
MGELDAVKGAVQVFRLRWRHDQPPQYILGRHLPQHAELVRPCVDIVPREELEPVHADAEVQSLTLGIRDHGRYVALLLLRLMLPHPLPLALAAHRRGVRLVRALVEGGGVIVLVIVVVVVVRPLLQIHPFQPLLLQRQRSRAHPQARRSVRLPAAVHDRRADVPPHDEGSPLEVFHPLARLYDEDEVGYLEAELESHAEAVHAHGRRGRPRPVG